MWGALVASLGRAASRTRRLWTLSILSAQARSCAASANVALAWTPPKAQIRLVPTDSSTPEPLASPPSTLCARGSGDPASRAQR